jgi:hypothetical protein
MIELKMTSQAFHELPGGPEMSQWHVDIQISFVQLLFQTEQWRRELSQGGGQYAAQSLPAVYIGDL